MPPGPGNDVLDKLDGWLRELALGSGSDLHLKAEAPPRIRQQGVLRPLGDELLDQDQLEALARELIPASHRDRFETRGEADFAYSIQGVGRFRTHVFRQRGSPAVVFRLLRVGGLSFEEIGLPPVVQSLAEEVRGLVLVTGPTGSGKTTTLAAMIDHINRTRPVHIVTIEDPIEVLHQDQMASVAQREVGNDTESFAAAVRAVMRADPDVILIGEMRDAETVQSALQAAETGHLVLSTLHTVDATETVNRIVDFFTPAQQNQVRTTLASALRGIVTQRLVPSVDGGRVPAVEVLVNTGRVADRILDPRLTAEIPDIIREGTYYGMQTFDQALLGLVRERRIELDDAMQAASQPHDFQLLLQGAGLVPVGRAG